MSRNVTRYKAPIADEPPALMSSEIRYVEKIKLKITYSIVSVNKVKRRKPKRKRTWR